MPPRKGSKARTASTRTKASNKEANENESIKNTALKEANVSNEARALAPLGESRAVNNGKESSSDKAKDSPKKKGKGGSRAQSKAAPSSPAKKGLPHDQIEAFLENYDLETQARIDRLTANLEITIQAASTRMKLAIDRIPRAVRELSLAEFIDDFGADIHAFMEKAPVQRLEEGRKEWAKLTENSPVKGKRAKKDEEDDESSNKEEATSNLGKSARRGNKTARSSTMEKAAPATKKKPSRSGTKGTRASRVSKAQAPTSPAPESSSSKAPSLAKFAPQLPAGIPPTPSAKPRMARPGEMIQWQSINGSPIIGVLGNDGVLRPVTIMTDDN